MKANRPASGHWDFLRRKYFKTFTVAGLSERELSRVRGRLVEFTSDMFESMARKDQRRSPLSLLPEDKVRHNRYGSISPIPERLK